MAKPIQYECFFLDAIGVVRMSEIIESFDDEEAKGLAYDMWDHRPHHHGMELWLGARRICFDTRMPARPSFVIRSAWQSADTISG